MMRRKHHCRSCGRIFCAACSAYREKIPSYYRSYAPSPSQTTEVQRTCAQCANNLRRAADVDWLVRALALMPVRFHQLFDLRLVSRGWNHAVNTLLSLYRGLQYKLPCQEYTQVERDFLWSHYAEFGGHIPWQIHTFASLSVSGRLADVLDRLRLNQTKTAACRLLMCTRTCHVSMSVDNIIHLGMSGCLKYTAFVHWVIQTWQHMQPSVHAKMMPWWVYLGLQYPPLFHTGLMPLCMRHIDLMFALWFECQRQETPDNRRFLGKVRQQMLNAVSTQVQQELHASMAFIHFMKRLVAQYNTNVQEDMVQQFFRKYPSAPLPWSPSEHVVSITAMKRYASATRPLKIQLTTQHGVTLDVLIKQEDVRTDRLAMLVGYWIQTVATDVHVHTYKVFPFDNESGCVVMIPDASTLYDVRKQTTLLNHLLSSNPNVTVGTLRNRIVSSCVGACLLAFTMGLGDRHLENVLVTSSGYLAHIDFGYVLGEDPKLAATPMRITEDMVEAIGGRGSLSFSAFVQRTQRAYESMRGYASFWYHLLSAEAYICGDKRRHWKRIRDHVLDRFVPGESDEEASLHIQTVVQRATHDTFVQRVADFAHMASNSLPGIFHMEL
jgi:hypothetical protein|tara:strand:- start:965 stop:2788 length:1824 start_codon:yes stop_codon:yes gene_type:complete